MEALAKGFATGSRSLSYVLGGLVLTLAGSIAATSWRAERVAQWAVEVFGVSFIILLAALVLATVFCWLRMGESDNKEKIELWHEAGQHGANGVATLALTYTLLGISLGIGTLADQDLNPETINAVIKGLTKHFSLAFMTTVVGLPVAALLRMIVSISARRVFLSLTKSR